MKKLKYFLLAVTFVMTGCHYTKDKLKVKNNSRKDIYYDVIIRYRDKEYYSVAEGYKIKTGMYGSPVVRGTILYQIETNSYDKILYIVYFNLEDREYVYKNESSIIFNKKFRVDKYSLKELDSMNWVVNYPR